MDQMDLHELRERTKRRLAELHQEAVERELTRPVPDALEKWRDEAEAVEHERAAERAERKRAWDREREREHEKRLAESSADIDARIAAAVAAERRRVLDLVSESVGAALADVTKELNVEIQKLKSEIKGLTAGGRSVVRLHG